MKKEDFNSLVDGNDIDKLISVAETHGIIKNLTEAAKQYDIINHDVLSNAKRPDKLIYKLDPNDDTKKELESTVKVSRIALDIQQKIVKTAVGFLGKPKMVANIKDEDKVQQKLYDAITKIWNDTKLDYKFKTIAKITKSELLCAELWYVIDTEPSYWSEIEVKGNFKLGVQILANSKGDQLYPVFDNSGDLIAFGRKYKIKDKAGKEIENFDIYTEDYFVYAQKENSKWSYDNGKDRTYLSSVPEKIANVLKKIPVIYYSQPQVEWSNVQALIDRLETLLSNHADTNDYSGSPIVVVEGAVKGFANKGEQGKLLETENGGKVSYLTYDNAPESIKMEIDNLKHFIYTLTQTPDVSFETMKTLSTFSGTALKMFFLDAHMKALDSEELFGECVQRRINFLKQSMAIIDISLKPATVLNIMPQFDFFMPTNLQEDMQTLATLKNAGLISVKTAMQQVPYINDVNAEIEEINSKPVDNGGGGVT